MRVPSIGVAVALAGVTILGPSFGAAAPSQKRIGNCLVRPGATCKKAHMRGAVLAGMNLTGASLRKADLRGANLRNSDLTRADLTGADLRGADLRGADGVRASLAGARFGSLNYAPASPQPPDGGAVEQQTSSCTAGARCTGSLVNANFSYSNLTGATFNGANIASANFAHANLTNANLNGASASHTDFSYANMTGAVWTYANTGIQSGTNPSIAFTDFSFAVLNGSNFYLSILHQSQLTGIQMSNANWGYVNLEYAIADGMEVSSTDWNHGRAYGGRMSGLWTSVNVTAFQMNGTDMCGLYSNSPIGSFSTWGNGQIGSNMSSGTSRHACSDLADS